MSERIEGVPVGTKLVAIRRPVVGEWIIDLCGKPVKVTPGNFADGVYPILEADNAYGAMDLTTVPIPDGYERDRETPKEWFRELNGRDKCFYLSSAGNQVYQHQPGEYCTGDSRRIILRKIKPKTKRVLVCEVELKDGEQPDLRNYNCSVWVYKNVAVGRVKPRIEERPIQEPAKSNSTLDATDCRKGHSL